MLIENQIKGDGGQVEKLADKGGDEELAKSIWEQGDNSIIAHTLNEKLGDRNEWSLGYSDYDFRTESVARKLGMWEKIENDPQYQSLLRETKNEKHFMVQLRAREILIDFLLPFVKSLSAIHYDEQGRGGYELVDGSGESYGINPKNIRALVGLLVLATKGSGHKSFALRESDFRSGKAMQAALEARPYRDFGRMQDDLRGQELESLVTSVFGNNKIELSNRYSEIKAKDVKSMEENEKESIESILKRLGSL